MSGDNSLLKLRLLVLKFLSTSLIQIMVSNLTKEVSFFRLGLKKMNSLDL